MCSLMLVVYANVHLYLHSMHCVHANLMLNKIQRRKHEAQTMNPSYEHGHSKVILRYYLNISMSHLLVLCATLNIYSIYICYILYIYFFSVLWCTHLMWQIKQFDFDFFVHAYKCTVESISTDILCFLYNVPLGFTFCLYFCFFLMSFITWDS